MVKCHSGWSDSREPEDSFPPSALIRLGPKGIWAVKGWYNEIVHKIRTTLKPQIIVAAAPRSPPPKPKPCPIAAEMLALRNKKNL